MLPHSFWRSLVAAIAFVLIGAEAGAESVSMTNCHSSYSSRGYQTACRYTTVSKSMVKPVTASQPVRRGATREDVAVRGPGKKKAVDEPATATRTDNFCGAGYRMTADGCEANKTK
jgi:hypothetical protein